MVPRQRREVADSRHQHRSTARGAPLPNLRGEWCRVRGAGMRDEDTLGSGGKAPTPDRCQALIASLRRPTAARRASASITSAFRLWYTPLPIRSRRGARAFREGRARPGSLNSARESVGVLSEALRCHPLRPKMRPSPSGTKPPSPDGTRASSSIAQPRKTSRAPYDIDHPDDRGPGGSAALCRADQPYAPPRRCALNVRTVHGQGA